MRFKDLLFFALINRKIYNIYCSDTLWNEKLYKDYGFRPLPENYKKGRIYYKIFNYACVFGSSFVTRKAAENGYIDLVDFIITDTLMTYDDVMYYGAKGGGHKKLIDHCIVKGATHYDRAIIGAAEGNHKDLIDFFLNKGARDLNRTLRGAIRYGHKDVVNYLIEKGADEINYGIVIARSGGNRHNMVEFLKQKKIEMNIY